MPVRRKAFVSVGWGIAIGYAFMALAFLGMVWLVERARWAFWKTAILKSGRCNYAGCICPCHGPIEANLSAKELDLMEGQFKPPPAQL